ncbi:hypothetical protein GMOD_00002006 [Pyrenophora seminiperda CCB06]|uniref:Uncharacterized protein n=1 Tax=Pyrenophora seminiperda CCB06 TaxID=1302712 RepID=A0A3M7LWS9_9PLEO|nr:hypothetical protein GMOD_00002006 [Pyrenophora seminiperda CCB06]
MRWLQRKTLRFPGGCVQLWFLAHERSCLVDINKARARRGFALALTYSIATSENNLFCIISVYIITFVTISSAFGGFQTEKTAQSVFSSGERILVVRAVFPVFPIYLPKCTLVILALIIFTMYHQNNTGSPLNQATRDKLSPNRPPQFNFRNCGYDCGLGCQKASDDEGDGGGSERSSERGNETGSEGGSDDTTAVDDNDNGYLIAEWQSEDGDAEAAEDRQENMSNPNAAEHDAAAIAQSSSPGEYDAMSESLVVEPCVTSDHSPMSSVGGSVRSLSPNPGILYWITNMRPVSPLPFEYHFLHTPLRLSPQYEHCRGDPASHLVGPDRRSTSFYLIEQA